MGNNHSGASGKRIYEDFEPFCEWRREEEHDTLNIHLEGFKREQLQVKTKKGNLVISGERPVDSPKWKRFRKEVKIGKHWKVEEISSELMGGAVNVLSIKIPKRPTLGRRLGNSFSRVNSKVMKSFSRLKPSDTALATMKSGVLVMVLLMLLVAFGAYAVQKYRIPVPYWAHN